MPRSKKYPMISDPDHLAILEAADRAPKLSIDEAVAAGLYDRPPVGMDDLVRERRRWRFSMNKTKLKKPWGV